MHIIDRSSSSLPPCLPAHPAHCHHLTPTSVLPRWLSFATFVIVFSADCFSTGTLLLLLGTVVVIAIAIAIVTGGAATEEAEVRILPAC